MVRKLPLRLALTQNNSKTSFVNVHNDSVSIRTFILISQNNQSCLKRSHRIIEMMNLSRFIQSPAIDSFEVSSYQFC